MSDNSSRAVAAMQSCGIFNIADDAAGRLNLLIQEQNQLNIPCFETRYIATNIDNKYIKNNNLLNFINKINELKKLWLSPHKINVKYALYHYERPVVVHSLLLLKSEGEYIPDLTIADAMTVKPPILPINATDIMDWFKISEGREVGVKLKHAENIWIKSDFTLSHNDIFKIMMNSQT